MISVQKADDRGVTDLGWLDSRHTFSFGHGQTAQSAPHPEGFSVLRVINDDTVAPGQGFGEHPHRDMEIISYIAGGAIAHKDSMGTVQTLEAGGVQRMSAGKGVFHSEFNPKDDEPLRLFQIWIFPREKSTTPSYEEKVFTREQKLNTLLPLVVSDQAPVDGALTMGQDASMLAGILDPGHRVTHEMGQSRSAWVHVIRGNATVNGQTLTPGDGAAVTDEASLSIEASDSETEVLVFDLPAA